MDLAATAVWLPILQIIWIDILRSGDNALVIALACRSLPAKQRGLGILVGSGAAIALRTVFTLLIAELLGLPFVKIAGGIVLLWIAIKLAGPELYRKAQPRVCGRRSVSSPWPMLQCRLTTWSQSQLSQRDRNS
jgi:predicted tellurium resistance membrane protein TerC